MTVKIIQDVQNALASFDEDEEFALEHLAARLRCAHDELLVASARRSMATHLPDYDRMVFLRDWDQDVPALVKLLDRQGGELDLSGGFRGKSFTREQRHALRMAEQSIVSIGDDSDIESVADETVFDDEGHSVRFVIAYPAESDRS